MDTAAMRALAKSCAAVLAETGGDILELGAGSGVMAADILLSLQTLDQLPERYLILERSADLRQRQQELLSEKIPDLVSRVIWLDVLHEEPISGVIIGNEVLDALPVEQFRIGGDGLEQAFVIQDGDGLVVHSGPDDVEQLGPWPDFYGQAIMIEHDRRWEDLPVYTLYGHVSEVLAQTGQQVRAGWKIDGRHT